MSANFSSFGGFSFLYGLHSLFCLAFLIGLIFFIAWALKNLKKEQLLNWSIALLIIGVLGWLLTISFGGYGMHGRYTKSSFGYGMMNSSTWNCIQNEECHEEMEEWMEQRIGIR